MKPVRTWRKNWKYPTSILCIYGFFSTIKPMEPFLVPYLTGPDKNLTAQQVNNEIFPVWTYSFLAVQVPVFLLTDWLRYKPIVILQCMALFITMATIRWVTNVPGMQVSQFFFGVATASDLGYYSYIYSMVDLNKYRKATSYIRSVQLLGYSVGSVLGQLLFSLELLSYNDALVFTLILIAIALLVSFFLPMPQRSMFFHRKRKLTGDFQGEERSEESEEAGVKTEDHQELAEAQTCGKVLLQMIRDFRECFASKQLLYWSLWWVMASCGFNQTVNFIQVLWEHVQPSQNSSIYNGGVEAVSSILSTASVYGIGYREERWEQWGELALAGFSGLCSVALFVMTFSSNIWISYASYIVFKCLYMVLMTIAMFHIATELTMERYALVFGANTFGALVLQTILTSIVVDSGGLALGIIPQFIVYASYFSLITAVFLLRGLYTIRREKKNSQLPLPSVKNEPRVCAEHKF
eukprot:XP_003977055.1 PREDICTED: thiamine transporter 2 [Takifugu rubripes]